MFSLLRVQEARVPDYTSLCKRSKTLNVPLRVYRKRGSLDVAVDSTGLKVYGESEWEVYKLGRGKRRTWRNPDIAMDVKTQQIVAAEMTSNSRDDASVVPDLLIHIDGKIVSLCGNGAYDKLRVITQPHVLGSTLLYRSEGTPDMIREEFRDQVEFTVTKPYLYRGYSAQTRGKSKLLTINVLSLKQLCSELKGCSGSV